MPVLQKVGKKEVQGSGAAQACSQGMEEQVAVVVKRLIKPKYSEPKKKPFFCAQKKPFFFSELMELEIEPKMAKMANMANFG